MAIAETISKKKRHLERQAAEIGVKCFNSFYFFFTTFWPEMAPGVDFVDNWHIKYICDTLQIWGMKVVRGEVVRQTIIINVPPGSSKSTIATVAFPLWMWLHKPTCVTVNISFSGDLAKDHQELSKQIPESSRWAYLFNNLFKLKHGKELAITTRNKVKLQNNFGGKRFNTGTTGNITGRHADIIIEDDPLDPEGAFSDAEREKAVRIHDQTISSRLRNDNCYLNIIIAQRLHEEDVPGHVLKQNIPITHICFPGEITSSTKVIPKECEKFYVNGILNPIRKGREVLDIAKAKMLSGYSTQILQLPFNLDEQDIKPSMFQKLTSVRDDIIWDVWVDGAFTEDNENDPSGIDLLQRVGNDLIWYQSYDVYKKLPDLLAFIVELEKTGQFDKMKSRIFIEPKASGTPLADYIEFETDYNFVRIGEHNAQERKLVQGGHKARHEMIKPKAESHRIKYLEGNWNEEAITQICGFPKAAHDEHVDNLGYAINHYYMNENTFIEEYAILRLKKLLSGSINMFITSQLTDKKISTSYEENDKGDIQLFDIPFHLHNYRYLCVLVLRGEGERGGQTAILIFDRINMEVTAAYFSKTISPKKAGIKAVEMAHLYDQARLIVAVQKEVGQTQNEEYDLSHIALAEARRLQYENIYSRLTINDIKHKREREFGFEVNHSTSREVYYNLKDFAESAKIKSLPKEVFDEMKLLERKKETGEVTGRKGYKVNAALAYSIALKVHDEWQEKPKVKKAGKW